MFRGLFKDYDDRSVPAEAATVVTFNGERALQRAMAL
jgi:hypothetical protein